MHYRRRRRIVRGGLDVHRDDAGSHEGVFAAIFVLLLVHSIDATQGQHTLAVGVVAASGGRCGAVRTRGRVGVGGGRGRDRVVAGGGTESTGKRSDTECSATRGERRECIPRVGIVCATGGCCSTDLSGSLRSPVEASSAVLPRALSCISCISSLVSTF